MDLEGDLVAAEQDRLAASDDNLQRWFARVADWPSAVLPAYGGRSIANLPASILTAMAPGADADGLLPALDSRLLDQSQLASSRVVILLVIDGLGQALLDAAQERDDLTYLSQPQSQATLTSVVPSTTAAALTTLQTGVGPGRHGMAGYTLYLPSQRQVYNMVRWAPVTGKDRRVMRSPEGFLPVPTIYQRFGKAGIDTVLVSNAAFESSPLTRVQASGVRFRGHRTLAELGRHVVRQVERDDQRRFVFAYWDGLDVISHSYGPTSPTAELELRLIDLAIGQGIIEPLASLGQDVTLLVTADHGHVPMPHEARLNIDAERRISNYLHNPPTGDARAMGLSFRQPEAREWLLEATGEHAAVIDVAGAVEAGLYGPGTPHPKLLQRVGDTLALARGETGLCSTAHNTGSIGGHGSLTAGEMLVPLLSWSWD